MNPDFNEFSLFKEINLDTAEELIKKLIPNEDKEDGLFWRTGYQYIFRGQKDADWELNPSAMREEKLQSYMPKPLSKMTTYDQRLVEWILVNDFATEVDYQGLDVPGDRPELRNRELTNEEFQSPGFPSVRFQPFYALAQHYGIPTRFLDWSWRPLVAAYFACFDIARQGSHPSRHGDKKCDGTPPKRFAVWALAIGYVEKYGKSINPLIRRITVPYASNPNLRAQKGLFTLVDYQDGQDMPISEEPLSPKEHLPSINEIVREWKNEQAHIFPFLCKLTLPSEEANNLLRILSLHDISAASVCPGHQGAADAVFERNWHQDAKPEDRS